MFNAKPLYVALLASIPCITYTADTNREYCITAADTCIFSKDRKDEVTIHNLACPPRAERHNINQFDAVDKLIFTECASLPYLFTTIINVPDTERVYVMHEHYAQLHASAMKFFQDKLVSLQVSQQVSQATDKLISLQVSQAAIETNENKSNELNLHSRAITRTNAYISTITRYIYPLHDCPGATVRLKALMCVLQVKCAQESLQ
jgi:hypothetical protein